MSRPLSDGLAAFLDWWDANPNDHDWWMATYPHLRRRFLAMPLEAQPAIGAGGMSERTHDQLQAIADKIERCLGQDEVDTHYLAEDTLCRLDTLLGNEPVRGQIVDFP